jgi:predicted transcriptional regulator
MTDHSIEEFITTFNRLHKAICRELGADDYLDFSVAVRRYQEKFGSWPHREDLLALGRLRNVLVHEQRRPKQYLAHPTEASLQTLRKVLDSFERPLLVLPRFQCKVVCVGMDEVLSEILPRVLSGNYSQFPVYDGDEFKGLLTENGIVRYLAHHRASQDSLIELAEVSVRVLLRQDENRKNFAFAPRTERLDALLDRFAQQPVLEAVLITANGKKEEKLLGIATQWDALEARKELRP